MIQEQQNYLLEMYRTGMRAFSDIANATLESTQKLQEQQSQAMREALQRNTEAARRVSEAGDLAELMTAQVRLATAHAQQTADFWTRAWRSAGESYSAMTRAAGDAANQSAEAMREAERRSHQQRKSA